MAEYIDKADLEKRLESRVKDYGRDCNSNAPIISRTYQAVLHMVENLPTADVVEVVRCCNCIHYKTNINKENYCDVHSTRWDKFYVRENDYCSYGERRVENESERLPEPVEETR